ncbi:MAG: YdcF family protein [Micavibrio aeruginosavorus]|uniref:YdcF family protein n=1 Tax=Micavibrio aeruginosavorus TaxID=349221 RepID=A0A2W5FJY6_9BACT|nr:MAG: YdcF family protein [Micavibrio aeruginosavorus]
MFFFLSKIFWILAQPLAFLGFLLLAGLLFYKKAAGKKILFAAALSFVFLGFLPVGPLLVQFLESRTFTPVNLPERVDGIIVLGGAVNAESSEILKQPQLNEWSERIFEMMRLSQTYPQARVIYAGGAGSLHGQGYEEATIVKKMLEDISFPTKNFAFETKSRNTYENAIYSKKLAHPQSGENWLLITSAFHIPRSKAVFEKQDWTVTPYPAGFIENGYIEPWQFMDVSGNYWKLNIAVKEIIGIIAYKLSGKI